MRVKMGAVLLGAYLGLLAVRANADTDTFGLTNRQVMGMPDSEWIAYYCRHAHNNGSRTVYRAEVVYANCEQEQNAADMRRLPAAPRKRFSGLQALLDERLALDDRSGRPGFASASHSLGARRRVGDLMRVLIGTNRHVFSIQYTPAMLRKQITSQMARLAQANASLNSGLQQNNRRILGLTAHWPDAEKRLVLNYLLPES